MAKCCSSAELLALQLHSQLRKGLEEGPRDETCTPETGGRKERSLLGIGSHSVLGHVLYHLCL